MSETIGEMIIPGTYIDVRAEGLIGVPGIATGNVGVVGTANRGPLNEVVVLGSYGEARDIFGSYDAWATGAGANPLTLTRALEQVFKGGASTVYAVRIANEGNTPMASMSWNIGTAAAPGALVISAKTPGTWANDISVSLTSPADEDPILTLQLGRVKEVYQEPDLAALAAGLAASTLVNASAVSAANASVVPTRATASATPGGPNGAQVTTIEFAAGLALLAPKEVNIIVAGGAIAKDHASTLLAHLEQTENDGRERIAVVGASTDSTGTLISDDVGAGSSPRLILVAPGLLADDAAKTGADKRVQLSAAYSAALVAGRLASLAPHVSLTNKAVPADGLTTEYTRAQQKQLLLNQVLVLHKNLGIRVLKGITTDTEAFRQISVRRIVDYAKAGVRLGSNPYIGRLNNSRVRAALKATLDGFLANMVQDEMLTGYTLDVSASRRDEIEGRAIVTMTLQPTFSIDFVKVIMNLQ
jgi:hypothetical protein